jgi:hypothetical protein
MSTIPYFLRNPNLDDQAQQPMTMAPAAAPQGMAAQVVQHPMHAMIAPIVGAPLRMSTMRPAEDPGQEPAAMSSSDVAKMGDQPATPPSIAAKPPNVRTMSPMERYEDHLATKQMADYAKDENPYGSDNNHPGVFGKILHGLSVATGGPNRRLFAENQREQQIEGTEKNIGEQALQGAQTGNQQAETNLHNTQEKAAQLAEISPGEAQSMGNPALAGQQVTQGVYQHLITNAGTTQGRQSVAELNNDTKRDIADANNLTKAHLATLKPEQRDDRAIRLMEKPADQRTPEENAYLGSYARWVQQTKVEPGIARGQAFNMFRPVQVLGPDGNVQYQTAGNAIKSGASTPQSMNFKTAAAMAKFMTSGKGGGVMTNYRTTTDHLDLLRQAITALDNGDVQGLNRLNNSFKEQFGSNAPTNVNVIRTMLSGELANVAKITGATDTEIKEQRENLNRASSPGQFSGFIDINQDLIDQKAHEMFLQNEAGMQGKPVFEKGGMGRAETPAGGTHPAQGGGNTPQRPAGVPPNAQYTTDPKTGKKGWAW